MFMQFHEKYVFWCIGNFFFKKIITSIHPATNVIEEIYLIKFSCEVQNIQFKQYSFCISLYIFLGKRFLRQLSFAYNSTFFFLENAHRSPIQLQVSSSHHGTVFPSVLKFKFHFSYEPRFSKFVQPPCFVVKEEAIRKKKRLMPAKVSPAEQVLGQKFYQGHFPLFAFNL